MLNGGRTVFLLGIAGYGQINKSSQEMLTSVSLGYGFLHPARFTAYYSAPSDESPEQTIRRSRLKLK